MKWRPIKTAPKDELILLASPMYVDPPQFEVCEGRWIEVPHENQYFGRIKASTTLCVDKVKGQWLGYYPSIRTDGVISFYGPKVLVLHPTHWMPKPKGPSKRYLRAAR